MTCQIHGKMTQFHRDSEESIKMGWFMEEMGFQLWLTHEQDIDKTRACLLKNSDHVSIAYKAMDISIHSYVREPQLLYG